MNFLLNTVGQDMAFTERVAQVFSNFDPVRDIIDILLLTIIFFFAYRFLKSRKTVAIIVGIAICLVLYALSVTFGLTALSSVFGTLVSGGPLLLIILFQQEIRDALERIGSGSLKGIMTFSDRRRKKEFYNNVIDNIVSAVDEMSSECTGALIVIERTTRLSDIVASGVVINADVNSSLIRNLFYNKAPLHDGAIVISEGRIAAAGCFLPMTRRNDINSDLGTRHRAALGMSECSDAVIIVVSEETGTVSVAYDRSLNRNLTAAELKDFLVEYIIGSHLRPTEG